MIKLSAVIITYNEARNIERCLNSLQKVADEMIVVDSFSEDGTQELARQCGATVIEHKFEGHIEQKNWAITQASSPYVLTHPPIAELFTDLMNDMGPHSHAWMTYSFL